MKLYSIKDTKSKYMRPFEEVNDDMAIRTLKAISNDKNTQIGMFPEDFELWSIGEFNETTAELKSEVKFLARAIDHVRKEN